MFVFSASRNGANFHYFPKEQKKTAVSPLFLRVSSSPRERARDKHVLPFLKESLSLDLYRIEFPAGQRAASFRGNLKGILHSGHAHVRNSDFGLKCHAGIFP